MSLPVVMPSNRWQVALEFDREFPNRMGLLFGPEAAAWKNPRGLPYALDNGRFSVWSKGNDWDEKEFLKLLKKPEKVGYSPLWVVVPDHVGNPGATLQEWRHWVPRITKYGYPLALAVQDGMTPDMVLGLDRLPDVIFVGGTTSWKWRSCKRWCEEFPRVHVGRANTAALLWRAHRCGAESSDGTGWWREEHKKQLRSYLIRSQAGSGERDIKGFFF